MTPKDTEYWDKNGNKMYQPPKNLKINLKKKEREIKCLCDECECNGCYDCGECTGYSELI